MLFRKRPNDTNKPGDELHLPQTHTEYPRDIPQPTMKPRSDNSNFFPYHAARGSMKGTNKLTRLHPAVLTPGNRSSQHSARKVSPARPNPQDIRDSDDNLISEAELKRLHDIVNRHPRRNISIPKGRERPRKMGSDGYDHRGISPPLSEEREMAEKLKQKEALDKKLAGTTRKAQANFDGDVGGWQMF